jgi:hypothetical protein
MRGSTSSRMMTGTITQALLEQMEQKIVNEATFLHKFVSRKVGGLATDFGSLKDYGNQHPPDWNDAYNNIIY